MWFSKGYYRYQIMKTQYLQNENRKSFIYLRLVGDDVIDTQTDASMDGSILDSIYTYVTNQCIPLLLVLGEDLALRFFKLWLMICLCWGYMYFIHVGINWDVSGALQF
eukprot:TRINITY_DN1057_c0_g1_i3.p3 TRINITY_DN1057_c0_g1~~TRINITY_DN1057_c0_g1_i3.p3  ORF type:complete len:108 (-),score=7.29 TRINITY_DN1057_c0_g1_i3:230-553(-)